MEGAGWLGFNKTEAKVQRASHQGMTNENFPFHRRQPYCSNTTNVNLCSHIWSICYLAQSVFGSSEIIAEPCLRKCPSGVNLLPFGSKPERKPKSRYGFALNYGIPMGQSTPKT
jgi:hypothetical protein